MSQKPEPNKPSSPWDKTAIVVEVYDHDPSHSVLRAIGPDPDPPYLGILILLFIRRPNIVNFSDTIAYDAKRDAWFVLIAPNLTYRLVTDEIPSDVLADYPDYGD